MATEESDNINEIATDEESAKYFAEIAGYDKWPDNVGAEFDNALRLATIGAIRNDFTAAIEGYRVVEAEFLPRVGNIKENVQQVRRHIIEMMLRAAIDKNEPFETCWKYWTELLSLGFYRIERRCHATWAFAYYCAEQQKTDVGLGLLEPLIVELERLLAEVDKHGATFYKHHLDLLVKLRARLEAERA